MKLIALAPLFLLAACSKAPAPAAASGAGPAPTPPAPETPAPATAADPVTAMNTAIDLLMAKGEHQDPEVTIQHLLVGVSGQLPGVTRSPGEAETLTAELFAKVLGGDDFDALVKNHTNDAHPGIYSMSLGQPSAPNVYPRTGMVPGFGDVAWRLAVGEVGIARFDGGVPGSNPKSPYGYHIIKRLK